MHVARVGRCPTHTCGDVDEWVGQHGQRKNDKCGNDALNRTGNDRQIAIVDSIEFGDWITLVELLDPDDRREVEVDISRRVGAWERSA